MHDDPVFARDGERKRKPGWRSREGCPFPLGVSWIEEEEAYNFALYSKHGCQVQLQFFEDGELSVPVFEFNFHYLENKSGPVWHCRIPKQKLGNARYYAYRVSGPAPRRGFEWHLFDPEKLLLDPYASSVYFPPSFDRDAARLPGCNAGRAPLSLLQDISCDCVFDWGEDCPPPRHDGNLIIYELHVRGFTEHPGSGVGEQKRGTFAGVVEKIPYLRDLGITAVELMPVFQFDPGEDNYWGYNPLNFFSPHHGYSRDPLACRQHDEFREMVRDLHSAGIEVFLDVVYNHTAEGDQNGPFYSFKGIDNSTYYMLTGNPASPYANYSGTGNTLHTQNRAVRQLIIDSLRHWVSQAHVDGFRFDLASIFARNPDGSASPEEPPIFGEITAHPELANIRLIAEPWDAWGLFQLGQRFPGTMWMQWNAAYRDTLQRFVRGDSGITGDLMSRLYGSADLFPDDCGHALHPWQSINYITSHDGFTLYDLTAYDRRNNWANGHGNTDGPGEHSWNCGWEGDSDVPAEVVLLRRRQVKNFFCLLMMSNGTPMFRMGDEFLNSQGGNNNPYNQDNETSWLDWSLLETNTDNYRFFKTMIAFRKKHPSISRSRFWREDIHWHGPNGPADVSQSSKQVAFCLLGSRFNDADLYVMINSAPDPVTFGIYEGAPPEWKCAVDTAKRSPEDISGPGRETVVNEHQYQVEGRSVVVLLRETTGNIRL
jgi:glycogen operon protein